MSRQEILHSGQGEECVCVRVRSCLTSRGLVCLLVYVAKKNNEFVGLRMCLSANSNHLFGVCKSVNSSGPL